MSDGPEAGEWPLVTVAIPLYRSAQFVDGILANVRGIAYPNVEVLISDRHGLDDAIDRLEAALGGDSRVRFLRAQDGEDWTEHYNILLAEARGKYMRWLPHDDLVTQCTLKALVRELEAHPGTMLVYGDVLRTDVEGRPVPWPWNLEDKHPYNRGWRHWSFDIPIFLVYELWCVGSFLGLFRRDRVMEHGLRLRPTHRGVLADHCFLAGLGLLGEIRMVPDFHYVKLDHAASTHSSWRYSREEDWAQHWALIGYLRMLEPRWHRRVAGEIGLWILTTDRRLRHILSKRPRRIWKWLFAPFRRALQRFLSWL
jgi:glycosyltransferase involved in cell wall biosynthesis